MASSGRENAEDKSIDGAAIVASDEGESHHSRGEHSRDDSVKYLGIARKRMRKILPPLPDMILLRLLGGKF